MSAPILQPRFLESDGTPVLSTAELAYRVDSYSHAAVGGPKRASISATGSREDLGRLMERLGTHVEIVDEASRCVWWGYVAEIRLRLGVVELTRTLRGMANRVAVAYTRPTSAGTAARYTTAWVQDDDSVAAYGTQELLLSLANASDAQAEALRDVALSERRFPPRKLDVAARRGSGGDGATITCLGWWARLDHHYYGAGVGYESHEVATSLLQKVGQSSYTASTIGSEDGADGSRYYDVAGGFGGFVVGDSITVSGFGEADNNGVKTVVDTISNTHLVVEEDTDDEVPGDTVTVKPNNAQKCAQSFSLLDATAWQLAEARIRAQAINSPGDSLQLQVCASSSGAPGTVLATATVAAADIPTDAPGWVSFAFDNTLTLAPATTYWLVVSRTGSLAAGNCYVVGIDGDATYPRGALSVYDTSAWAVRSPAADLAFVLVGSRETTDQVEDALTTSGEFEGVEIVDAAGLYTNPYRSGDNTALTEVEPLLKCGTTSGQRLLVEVTREGYARVYEAPTASDQSYALHPDGRLEDALGQAVPAYRVAAGIWVRIKGLPASLGVGREDDPGLLFWEEVEYNASSDTLRPVAQATRSAWAIGGLVEG